MKHKKYYFIFIVGILSLVGWYFAFGPSSDKSGGFYNKNENAVWLEHEWVDRPKTTREIFDLIDNLAKRGVRYVYMHVGPVESNGMIPPERYLYASDFLKTAKAYGDKMQFLAWIGQIRAKIPYEDSAVRGAFVETTKHFMKDIGYDGIHFDIEPVWDSDSDFLFLLDETRDALGENALISVALRELIPRFSGKILSYFLDLDTFNSPDFYQKIADRADQIVLMTYENSIKKPWLYQYFVKNEVIWATQLLSGVKVFIGLPTYDKPSLTFYPEAENIENGLKGIVQGLNNWRSDKDVFGGVALYRYGTTSQEEWKIYDALWARK